MPPVLRRLKRRRVVCESDQKHEKTLFRRNAPGLNRQEQAPDTTCPLYYFTPRLSKPQAVGDHAIPASPLTLEA